MKGWSHISVRRFGLFALTCLASACPLSADAATADPGTSNAATQAGLSVVAQSRQSVWNGVVVAPDGRLFVVLPRIANQGGPSLASIGADGGLLPYPDASWNGAGGGQKSQAGDGPGLVFVGLNAIHLAPDGALWAVDTGAPGFGKPAVHHGARLIRIDLASNQVTRVLTLPDEVLRPKSMIDDIRFNGGHAYITDAGSPGLIVLDLGAGTFRRLLDQSPALTARRPIVVDGDTLRGPDGKPVMLNADQLEVSPDGATLYVQPLCGPMSRIATALLDDPGQTAAQLAAGISFWYDTPALGGTAIMPDGTLLLNDLEDDSILSLSPDRVLSRLIADPRLHWADAPFLGQDGTLTVPVPQLDRAAPFQHGRSRIAFPVFLYAVKPAGLIQAAAKAQP